jgi:methanogenic corrinoid protein MtbC1
MPVSNPALSAPVLRSAPRALAEYTLVRHLELDPGLLERYGPAARPEWRRDIEARLANLAAALEVGRPELFADFVCWQREGFVARGVPTSDLQRSLECLREVLEDELPEAARPGPLQAIAEATGRLAAPAPEPAAGLAGDGPHRDLARHFLVELLEWRGEEAERRVLEAVEAGLSVAELYAHVFVPVEVEVGRLWHAGDLSIAEEHYVTGAIQGLMSRLASSRTAAPRDGRTVVVCAVGGDAHDMAVRMLGDFFRWDGWRVRSLGSATPAPDVVQAVADAGAQVVALSATMISHVGAVIATVRALRADERTRDVRVLVGGPPFNVARELWREVGADGWAADAPGAVEQAERLVTA